MSEEERICRNCHEAGGELIKPCRCSGSLQWVHRDCLNTWRSVSPNPASFSRCDICHEHYYMRRKSLGAGPYAKMIFGMLRDIFLVILVVALIIAIPGGCIAGLEYATHFMDDLISDSDAVEVITNPVFDIFVWGAAFDCFIIGLCGIGYGIAKCIGKTCETCCCCPVGERANTYYTYNTYSYHSTIPSWWWWYVFLSPPRSMDPCCCCCCCCMDCCSCEHHHHHGGGYGNCSGCTCDCGNCDCDCKDCNCGGCDCGGGNSDCGDAGAILLVIVIVIVIIIILIGFVIGLIFLIGLTARIIKNHITILQKQKDAQELEVIDLSHGLAKDDPSIVVIGDNYDFSTPFAGQGDYAPPAKEQQYLLAQPTPVGYPEAPVMSAGVGPTAPVMVAGEGPTAPVMVAGEGPTAPVMPAGEGPTAPPPDNGYDPSVSSIN